MSELYQHKNFRNLRFSTTEEGVFVRENHFLRFKTKEHFVSFLDLGIDTVKENNREGIPTLVIIGFMSALDIYLVIVNLSKKPSLSLFLAVSLFFFALVIVFTIQNYIKATFRIVGGKQEMEILRYKKGEADALQFIEHLSQQTKKAQVIKYNYLVKHFTENEHMKFPLLDTDIKLSDTDYKLLQYKSDLLYRNLLIEEDEEELNNDETLQ